MFNDLNVEILRNEWVTEHESKKTKGKIKMIKERSM